MTSAIRRHAIGTAWGVVLLLTGGFIVTNWAPLSLPHRALGDDAVLVVAVLLSSAASIVGARTSTGRERWVWLLLLVPAAAHLAPVAHRWLTPDAAVMTRTTRDYLGGLTTLSFVVPGAALLAEETGRAMFRRLRGSLDYVLIMTCLIVLAFFATLAPARAGQVPPDIVVDTAAVLFPVAGFSLSVWSLVFARRSWTAWRGCVGAALAAAGIAVTMLVLAGWLRMDPAGSTAVVTADFLTHSAFALVALAGAYRLWGPQGDSTSGMDPLVPVNTLRSHVASSLSLATIPVIVYLALAAQGEGEHAFVMTAAGILASSLLARGGVLGAENRLLEAQRMVDPVTGLHSEARFKDELAREAKRAVEHGETLTLCVAEITVTAGAGQHPRSAGPADLARVGAIALGHEAGIWVAGRLGDSLALLLPGVGTEEARAECARMKDEVLSSGEGTRGLDLSLGVASIPEHAGSAEDLLRFARGASYWAATLGGRDVVVYDPSLVKVLDARDHVARLERKTHTSTVEALAATVDARDSYTRDHSQNVADYADALARAIGLPAERIETIHAAGLLHDIGKIGIPDDILLKCGPLTEEQWRVVRGHPAAGERILKGVVRPDMLAWVRAHHERWDGAGYPDGIAGPDIPLEARILAVCDAFDAMTSNRAYRPAFDRGRALGELAACAGTQFDPVLVEAFARVIDEGDAPVAVTVVQSEDLVRALHPTLPSAVAEVMPDFTFSPFRAVTPAARDMLGFTAEEIMRMTPEELLGQKTNGRHSGPVRMLVQALRAGQHPLSEREIRTKDGSKVVAELFPSLLERQGRTYVVYTMRPLYSDGTTRRAVERRVHQLEMLVAATRALNGGLGAEEVLQTGLEAAIGLMQARQAGIGLIDGGGIVFRYRTHDSLDIVGARRDDITPPYSGVIDLGEPLISNGLEPGAIAAGVEGIEPAVDAVVVRVVSRDGMPIGVLEVHNAARAYFAEDANILEGLAAAIAIALDNAVSRQELEEREATLLEQGAALRQLTAQLAITEERERRTIAADLHDRIGQWLQMSTLLVSQAEAEEDREQIRDTLRRAHTLLAQAIRDTRTLMFEISPPVLYDIGLEAAFDWLAENVESNAAVSYDDDDSSKPLDDTVRALVFRMARELVINAIKHSGADSIGIATSRLGDHLVVQVTDDGRGFDPDRVPDGHFGLHNLRAQVSALSGRLEFVRRPEGGTIARFNVPLLESVE